VKTTLFTILLFAVLSRVSGQVPDSLKFKSLDPYYFHLNYLKEEKALLIDVREFFEYRKSRINGAVNIPSSGNIEIAADTIDKELHLFFYCTSGFRSKRVAIKFYDYGFRNLYNLEGGIAGWRKEGMAVSRKRIRRRG
jgi:rhodanese-related sulfurtransferase